MQVWQDFDLIEKCPGLVSLFLLFCIPEGFVEKVPLRKVMRPKLSAEKESKI